MLVPPSILWKSVNADAESVMHIFLCGLRFLRIGLHWKRSWVWFRVMLGACSAKTTKPPYSSLSMLVVVLVHLIVRSETALVA
jgi:hypothetical protein